jgi:hypothetical protein
MADATSALAPVPRDPRGDACPDFAGPVFAPLIEEARKEIPGVRPERTSAAVVAEMEHAWKTHHDTEVATWQEAKRKWDEEERRTADAAAQKAREADEEKRVKIPPPDEDAGPSDEAPLIVHPFASKRVAAREYVPLDYWSKPAMLRAQAQARTRAHGGATETDTELVAGYRITAPEAAADSKIRDDRDLSWPETEFGAAGFVKSLREHGYESWLVQGLTLMYARLAHETDFRSHEILGDQVIVAYSADVRWEIFDAIKRKAKTYRPENISVTKLTAIQTRLLREHSNTLSSVLLSLFSS